MVAPNPTGTSFDVLLAFTLDEAANKRVQAGASSIQDELKQVQEEAKKAGESLNRMSDVSVKKTNEAGKSITFMGARLANLEQAAKKTHGAINTEIDKNLRKYKQLQDATLKVITVSSRIGDAAASATPFFARTALLGTALVGGALAEANRYASNADKSTQATRQWAEATERLARARAQVDAVLLQEALPLLQRAASLATQAAAFVEKHPEIVRAALNTGLVLAGLGAVGVAVTKGIQLVADAAYIGAVATELVAAKTQLQASQNQLTAAGLNYKAMRKDLLGGGGSAAGLGGSLQSAVTSPLGIAALLAGSLVVINKADQELEKLYATIGKMGEAGAVVSPTLKTVVTTILSVNAPLFQAVHNFNELKKKIAEFNSQAESTPGTLGSRAANRSGAGGLLGGSREIQDQVVQAFSEWRTADAQIVRDAGQQRAQIIADAEKQILDLTRNYNQQRASIAQRFSSQAQSITQAFLNDSAKMEQDYANQRAEIVRDAGEAIQQIERDHQENLRQMAKEHADRSDELIASRDALGLVKEQRRFDEQVSEAERATNLQIAQQRRDTALRLAEASQRYLQEREQRRQQYEQDIKENSARRAEALKEAAAAHQEQLKAAHLARVQQLKDLQEGMNAERQRRREMFIAQIRDLDVNLLGERNTKLQYYNLMLQDAQAWLTQYRATLNAGLSATGNREAPTRDMGGYVERGLYRMAWDGRREFVMNNSTTRAAEQVIGGQLNQGNILQMLSMLGNLRNSMQYVDNREFASGVSARDRRDIRQDTIQVIETMLR